MIKKLITLFKLGRKIAKSDLLKITSKFQEQPIFIKVVPIESNELDNISPSS